MGCHNQHLQKNVFCLVLSTYFRPPKSTLLRVLEYFRHFRMVTRSSSEIARGLEIVWFSLQAGDTIEVVFQYQEQELRVGLLSCFVVSYCFYRFSSYFFILMGVL